MSTLSDTYIFELKCKHFSMDPLVILGTVSETYKKVSR